MIKTYIKHLLSKFYYIKTTKIKLFAIVSKGSSFEPMTQIHEFSEFYGFMGMGSYIGKRSRINANIGRFTSIGNDVSCNSGTHPYQEPFVSTSPCFYSLNSSRNQCGSTFATAQVFNELRLVNDKCNICINIGNDVWIGDRAFLTGGINIGDGAVILAGSVVTKNVPPFSIVGGVPARIVKYRYDQETIDFIIQSQWWKKEKAWYKKNWKLLTDISAFKDYFKYDYDS